MTCTSSKIELAAPTLAQSHKAGINLASAAHLLIEVPPYPGMDEGDLIELFWDNCYVASRVLKAIPSSYGYPRALSPVALLAFTIESCK